MGEVMSKRTKVSSVLAIGALLLGAFVAWKTPAQLPVIIYKLFLVNLAALVAHVLDVVYFGGVDRAHNDEIARALVFVGVMLALTLGL